MNELQNAVKLAENDLNNLCEYKVKYLSRCLQEGRDKKHIAVLERELSVIREFQNSCYELIKELLSEKTISKVPAGINSYADYSNYLSRNWANIKRFEHGKK